MKTKSSYDWVSYVERAILDLDDIPLLGKIPTFPWDSFAQSLGSFLGIEGLKIRSSQWHWYSSETLAENLGDSLTCLNFSALPVQGKVSFLLPELDAYSLVHWLVQKKAKTHSVLNSQFASGLLTYLSVEALSHLQKQSFFDGFLLRYLSEDSPPSVRCLGVDVLFEACGETLTGRLLIPEVFRKSWMTHFLERPKHLTKEMSQTLELSCSLEAGSFFRSTQDWKEVKRGDFIPVDNCLLDPDKKAGSLNLKIGKKALFRVRLKDEGFKVLEQNIFEEEFLEMDDENEPSKGLPNANEEDFEGSSDPEELGMLDDTPAGVEEEKHELASVLDKVEDIPLHISVELTHFKMTCEKLMQLKPGNLLELNLKPEKPVDLIANGKKIAQGELIRVGEVLGVRILNIG